MPEWTEADFDLIGKRLGRILIEERRRCKVKETGASNGCWCFGAGPEGGTLPCPKAIMDTTGEEPQFAAAEVLDFQFGQMPVPWSGRTS